MYIGDPDEPGKHAISTNPILCSLKSNAGCDAVYPFLKTGKLFLESRRPIGYPTITSSSSALNALSVSWVPIIDSSFAM